MLRELRQPEAATRRNRIHIPSILKRRDASAMTKAARRLAESVVSQRPAEDRILQNSREGADKKRLRAAAIQSPVGNQDQRQVDETEQEEVIAHDHLGHDREERRTGQK